MIENAFLEVVNQLPMVGVVVWIFYVQMKHTGSKIDKLFDVINKLIDKHENRS